MALARTGQSGLSSSTSDPTVQLSKALSEFEAVLSGEQKTVFRSNFQKPQEGDVVAFVSRIDAENKIKSRRCVGPRLCTFLERAQQFTTIVDTFVSSNPNIAALIWGGVKTAVLAASNYSSYFDKITSMIMKIGKTCPTYRQFGELYPTSLALQASLCDYYAAIIRLCTKIILVGQRSAVAQIFSPIVSPYETDFKTEVAALDEATNAISVQLLCASQQAAREDARLAELRDIQKNRMINRLHFDMKKESQYLQKRMTERENAKLRSTIRDNLTPIDHVKHWKQTKNLHLPGTVEWIHHEDAYKQWLSQNSGAILFCSGKLGTGKSVLASTVVAHLSQNRSGLNVVSYFFCRSDNAESLLAKNILGSLCCQILDKVIQKSEGDKLNELVRLTEYSDVSEIVTLMRDHSSAGVQHYLVVDGLDECEACEIKKLGRSLHSLCKPDLTKFKIFCSGRPELEKELFVEMPVSQRISLSRQHVDKDIDDFIMETLDQCLEGEMLRLNNPVLITEIAKTICEGANGIFLWARLVIEEVCSHDSDDAIMQALNDLPQGLYALLQGKLERIKAQANSQQMLDILRYTGVARQPLLIEGLREVLSVRLDQEYLQRDLLSNRMQSLINSCCGLLYIDEEYETVHYVHHSVRTYLFHGRDDFTPDFDESAANLYFGKLCLTYLNFSDFQTQLMRVEPGKTTQMNPLQIALNATGHDDSLGTKLARHLLKRGQRPHAVDSKEMLDMVRRISPATLSSMHEPPQIAKQYAFLDYAKVFWIYHLRDLPALTLETPPNGDVAKFWALFVNAIDGNLPAETVWEYRELVDIRKRKIISSPASSLQLACYRWALENDHGAVLIYLSHKIFGADLRASTSECGFEMLLIHLCFMEAATNDKKRISEVAMAFIYEWFIDVYLSERTLGGILCARPEFCSKRVLRPLLDRELVGTFSQRRRNQLVLLEAAIHLRQISVIEYLLDQKINPFRGHEISPNCFISNTVRQMTENGVVPKFGLHTISPLEQAIFTRDRQVILATIQKVKEIYWWDINQAVDQSKTVRLLEVAVMLRFGDVVLTLIRAGADPNLTYIPHRQASSLYLCRGYVPYRCAVQMAAASGDELLLQELLLAGADPDHVPEKPYQDSESKTALEIASAAGHDKCVETLLAAGATGRPKYFPIASTSAQMIEDYIHSDPTALTYLRRDQYDKLVQ